MGVYLGNKTLSHLLDVSLECSSVDGGLKISILQPIGSTIEGQKQECLIYNIECLDVSISAPLLNLEYSVDSQPKVTMKMRLPVLALKFVEPVVLDSSEFKSRWSQLGDPALESVNMFPVKPQADISTLLKKFRFEMLDIENSKTLAAAGIYNSTRTGRVGCLVEIAEMKLGECSLTLRSTNAAVSECLGNLLSDILSSDNAE